MMLYAMRPMHNENFEEPTTINVDLSIEVVRSQCFRFCFKQNNSIID